MNSHKFIKAHQRLSGLRNRTIDSFQKKHKHALSYFKDKQFLLPSIREHSAKLITSAALATSMFLGPGHMDTKPLLTRPPEERIKFGLATSDEIKKVLAEKILSLVPGDIGKLPQETRDKINKLLKDVFGLEASSSLDNKELNYAFGWMGYEQHLQRYPGDTLEEHDSELQAGIAPGLGAWGYFSSSKEDFDNEKLMMEKYYVAVQTLYLPEWYTNTKELSNWYKHRKVIVVNPSNGKACIAVVGDAGPASWTGKQFGGSPELMKGLDLHLGPRKGKVILLFVDDKYDEVPLGPIDFHLKAGKPNII